MFQKSGLVGILVLLAMAPASAGVEDWAEVQFEPLRKLIVTPFIKKRIQDANSEHRKMGKPSALKRIHRIDTEWKNSIGMTNLVQPYITGTCAKHLNQARSLKPYITEIMVMDELGAIVCASSKTSDFWQGDELKWQKAYLKGAGKNFVSKPAFDESTQSFAVHVSFPVKENEKVIGVISVGVDLDEINTD